MSSSNHVIFELTPDLRKQLGDLFIVIDEKITDAEERERCRQFGIRLLEQNFLLLKKLRLHENVKIPKLYISQSDDGPKRQHDYPLIAVNPNDTEAQSHFIATLKQYEAGSEVVSESHNKNSPEDIASLRSQEGDGFDFSNGNRDFDFTRSTPQRNGTRGYIYAARAMAKEDPTQWDFWQKYLFREDIMEKYQPGEWVQALRQLSGRTADMVADAIGMDQANYSAYENGKRGIGGRLREIACRKILDKNLFSFPADSTGKVQDIYSKKFLDKVSQSQVLDPVWLNAQPDQKRAALVLKFFRQKADLRKKDLADKISVAEKTVKEWETGEHPIDCRKLLDIKKALSLGEQDYLLLLYARLPNLKKDNLNQHSAVEERAGLLIKSYYEAAGFTQIEFSQELGVSQGALSMYVIAKSKTPPSVVKSIIDTLSVFGADIAFDEKLLVETVTASNDAIRKRGYVASVGKKKASDEKSTDESPRRK